MYSLCIGKFGGEGNEYHISWISEIGTPKITPCLECEWHSGVALRETKEFQGNSFDLK